MKTFREKTFGANTLIWMFIVLVTVYLTGCRKNLDPITGDPSNASKMTDLKVSSGFNWSTTREVTLTIGMNLPEAKTRLNSITVYDADPYKDGKLIFSGSAGNDFSMVAKIRIPTCLSQLWLQLVPTNGQVQIASVPVADQIVYTFDGTGGTKNLLVVDPGPDCSTYDYLLNGSGSQTIADGKTYAVTTSYDGDITVTKGTLKICGTFTGSINMGDNKDNSEVVISSTGNATASSISQDDHAVLSNYGTLVINSNFTPKSLVQNFGTMTVNAQYNMNGNSGNMINSGTLTINSHWNVINAATNNGTIEVFGDMNCNNSTFFNGCKLIVHGFFHLNNCEFTNQSGYIKCYQELKVMGGQAFMKLIDQSLIETYDMTLNKNLIGIGMKNSALVTHDLRIDGGGGVVGNIEVAQTDGVLAGGSLADFSGGATFVNFDNITNSIPASACSPGVNPPNPPPPGPHNNYVTGTAVWEDLWPSMGDYDMNDLVMYYKYNVVTNDENLVTRIVAKFYVKAAGAAMRNGFGFQIDNLDPSQIESVTGCSLNNNYITLNANGTEANQSRAVIIPVDNIDNVIHRAGSSSFFNTLENEPVGTADTVTVTIILSEPLSTTVVGTAPFNLFMIKNHERPVEIHLPGYAPTALASAYYFGTGNDDSNPGIGRYYLTSANLPWCLNLPVDFDYPFEYVEILQAYNHFAEWAQSSGSAYPDWYMNKTGYRDSSKIWHL